MITDRKHSVNPSFGLTDRGRGRIGIGIEGNTMSFDHERLGVYLAALQ